MKSEEIYLTEEEQIRLNSMIHSGNHNSHEIIRAKVLLMLDRTGKTEDISCQSIAEKAEISRQAVYNMRKEYLKNHDITSYITRKKRETPQDKSKIDGKVEAEIIALACSKPPKGHSRWTIRLLAEKTVELHFIDSLSHMTVQRLLKKTNISLI